MSRALFWTWVGAFWVTVLSGLNGGEAYLYPIWLVFAWAAAAERMEWEL